MVINSINTLGCQPQTIVIGRRGTYDTMQIAFDLSYLVESFGNGVAVSAVKRSQDTSAYPAVTAQEDNTLTWTVSETDTAYVGAGECQLMWYVDGGLAKTIIYPLVVMRDILSTSEEAPDAYQEWVDALIAEGAETLQNAQNAAQSASDAENAKDDTVAAKGAAEAAQQAAETAVTHYPKIENNYWMVWDASTQQYVSTGIQAEGEDGYSPEVTITSIEGGHRVTITDKDHPQGQSFDVMDGQGGGGTSDYNSLTNKPSINNVILSGNKTAADLGLATPSDIPTTAGDIEFDDTQTYPSDTVGAELSNQKNAIGELNRHLSDLEGTVSTTQIINTASGAIASFSDGADNMPVKKLVAQIEPVQAGTGDPSPDNIRPISGHTGAEISNAAVNIWDEEWEVGQYNATTGKKADNSNNIRSKNFISCKPNTAYSFVWDGWTDWAEQILFYDANYNFLNKRKSFGSLPSTFTTPEDAHYMTFFVGGVSTYNNDISINYPATDTQYHPYTGNQISVTFPDTIYGGEDEVISGKLKSTMGMVDMGDIDWIKQTGSGVSWFAKNMSLLSKPMKLSSTTNATRVLLSCYDYIGFGYAANLVNGKCITNDNIILIRDDSCATEEDFIRKVTGQMLCYELATHTEYTLAANEMTTFYGTNNIWSSTGDTEVTYPADTKLYIDNKITRAIANALNS